MKRIKHYLVAFSSTFSNVSVNIKVKFCFFEEIVTTHFSTESRFFTLSLLLFL